MTPIIPSLSPLFEFLLPRNISGTDFGTGYGGTVCGFHTRPVEGAGYTFYPLSPMTRCKEMGFTQKCINLVILCVYPFGYYIACSRKIETSLETSKTKRKWTIIN